MKRILMMVILFVAMIINAAPYVTNVVAKQRAPWGIVDISCDVLGIEDQKIEFFIKYVLSDSGVIENVTNVRFRGDGNHVGLGNLMAPTNGNYHFVWKINEDIGQYCYTNMIVRVGISEFHEKVQLWDNGPYWATTNIGAEKPEDYGYYFWWGDTVGYKRENDKWVASDGSNSNFSFSDYNVPTYFKNISTQQSKGCVTADRVLAPEHDAAQVHWDGNWRMPTADELTALNSNCDWTWTTQNGVKGYIVNGRGAYASNSIFLPAAGYGYDTSLNGSGSRGIFWSSVPHNFEWNAVELLFHASLHDMRNEYLYYGLSVRPVLGFTK